VLQYPKIAQNATTALLQDRKGSPYSIAERSVPELIPVLGSQPAGDVSHKPDDRLLLLSARPAVGHHFVVFLVRRAGICDIAEDYVSAPFRVDRLPLFKDGDSADTFFRPALRSLLVSEH